ncbi:MAG: hypothetical protein AAF738_09235 [Bacteroidota bacterium]
MKKLLVLLGILSGCSPKVVINNYHKHNSYPEIAFFESFALIEKGDWNSSNDGEIIADIAIKEQGLSINCDYESVKRLAEKEARRLGGNCLVITEHKEPDIKSTCHRIEAQVMRIKNPEQYEQQILWHSKRPLKVSNFRGSIEKRPAQAATYSMIRYYATTNPLNGKARVIVESLFDCELSYFKNSDYDSWVLAHEQLHFDITEIYARKFRKAIVERMSSYSDFSKNHESIFSDLYKKLAIKQDEYDAEVYSDTTQQSKWKAWVATEMRSLEEYHKREILLNVKNR